MIKDQRTIEFFDKLYGKRLQDKLIDDNENEVVCNVLQE